MKKFGYMLLVLVLLFSMTSPVLAAETREVCTSHVWQYRSTMIQGMGTALNSQACRSLWLETRTCTECGYKETVRDYTENGTHMNYGELVDATCDGYTQTHRYYCYSCGQIYPLVTMRCPGAGHGGVCDFLPI